MHRCSQKLGNLDAELEEQLLGEYQAQGVHPQLHPFSGVVPLQSVIWHAFGVAIYLPG